MGCQSQTMVVLRRQETQEHVLVQIIRCMCCCCMLSVQPLLGLSKKYPYLKRALSQKTWFFLQFRHAFYENARIFLIMQENVRIFTGNVCIFLKMQENACIFLKMQENACIFLKMQENLCIFMKMQENALK